MLEYRTAHEGLLNEELDTRTVHYNAKGCFNMYKDMESFVEAERGKTCRLGRIWLDFTEVTFELRLEGWVGVCQWTKAPQPHKQRVGVKGTEI